MPVRSISVIAQTSHITACRHGKKRRALGRDMQMVQLSLTSSAASSLAEGAISAPVAGQAMPSFGRRAARVRVNGERGNGSGALAITSFARASSSRARSPTEGFRVGVSMTCSGCVSPFSVASTCASVPSDTTGADIDQHRPPIPQEAKPADRPAPLRSTRRSLSRNREPSLAGPVPPGASLTDR